MTPFIGYKIEYCRPEPIKNNDNEETGQYKPDCGPERDDSQKPYVQVSKNWEKFKFSGDDSISQKRDLFPSGYLDGRWYFAKSLIKLPSSEGSHEPPQGVKLIQFEKTAGRLKMTDMSGNVDDGNRERLEESIPVSWKKYTLSKQGGNFEKFGERKDESCISEDCPYARIDFSGEFFNGDYDYILKNLKIEKREIKEVFLSKEYFSLTFESEGYYLSQRNKTKKKVTQSIEEKWSFLRDSAVDDTNHKPRRFFADDRRYFGVFDINPQEEPDLENNSEADIAKNFRLLKMAPNNNGEIIWRFSSITSKNPVLREIGRKAVKLMNQAFQEAGRRSNKKITVRLMEDREPDLGDIRYNLISLAGEEEGGEGGYGPSYANPDTGQIISATANVWIRYSLRYYMRSIRQYIRYELFQRRRRSEKDNKIHGASPFIREKISSQCPDIEQWTKPESILASLGKAGPLLPYENIESIIKNPILECAETIYKANVLSVLIHEMGHNFALRHNFRASAGKAGFYKSKDEILSVFPDADLDNGQIAKASSMMDYLPTDVPQMTVPGKYDIAALRYLYFDQVEMEDGEIKDLPWANTADPDEYLKSQEPLDELPDIKENMRKYSYCHDYQINDLKDPLCAKWDYGPAPKEAAEFQIENIIRDSILNRYRYDTSRQKYLEETIQIKILDGRKSILNTYMFYLKWLAFTSSFKNKTLSFFENPENMADEYKKFLRDRLTEDNISDEYKLYHEVREPAFDFFLDLLTAPEAKCHVMDNKTERKRLIPLERIKKSLLEYNRNADDYVIDCSSPLIAGYLAGRNKTLFSPEKLTGEEMFYETDGSYMMEQSKRAFDVSPPSPFMFFTKHLPPPAGEYLKESNKEIKSNFAEKILQEPDFFARFKEKMEAALLGDKEAKFSFLSPLEEKRIDDVLDIFLINANLYLGNNQSAIRQFNKSHLAKAYSLSDFMDNVFNPLNNYFGAGILTKSGQRGCARQIAEESLLTDNAFVESMWPCYVSSLKSGSRGGGIAAEPNASAGKQPAEAAEEKAAQRQKPATAKGFWKFIENNGGLLSTANEDLLITPLSRGSLAARLICKYKENKRRIDEIENRSSKDPADSNCKRLAEEDLEETERGLAEIRRLKIQNAGEEILKKEEALEDKKEKLIYHLTDDPSKKIMPEDLYEREELENHNKSLLDNLQKLKYTDPT